MTKSLHHFDKRILPRSIRKGLVSDAEFQSSLSELPDSSDNIAPPEPEEGSAEALAAAQEREAGASPGGEGGGEPSPAGSGSGPVDPASGDA